jgi:hypothetical protein
VTFRDDEDAARARVAAAEAELRSLESTPCGEEYQELRARLDRANSRIAWTEEKLRLLEDEQTGNHGFRFRTVALYCFVWLAMMTLMALVVSSGGRRR